MQRRDSIGGGDLPPPDGMAPHARLDEDRKGENPDEEATPGS